MITELVLPDLIKSWTTGKLAWRLDDFAWAAICYADDVVLVAVSKSAAENNGDRGDCKIENGRSVGWCTENTLDEFSEDDGQKHHGGWTGCVMGRSTSVCGFKGVLGRERKTRDRTQICSSQRMYGEVETSSEFLMASQVVEMNIVKTTMWQAFLWSSSVWTTVKAQRDKISSWSARMVANVVGVKRPPWMEVDQWWRLWHRTGHRWIEKGNMNVLTAIRERVLSWAGHVARMDHKGICAKALSCRGLQWWRWRQLHWKEVEKDKWSGPHPQRFKIYR